MADSSQPYGDVAYADPGYQKDGKKRYPIDSAEHTRAAWAYINQGDNASAYSAEQLASIKGKIRAAAKKFGIEIAEEQQEAGRSDFKLPFSEGGPVSRSILPGPGFVEAEQAGERAHLVGTFAPYDEWAEINSSIEGHFMERHERSAWSQSLQERHRGNLRVLFHHGEHSQTGVLPLGEIERLEEGPTAVDYDVALFDQTDYVQRLLPAMRSKQFGTSWTFHPVRGKFSVEPRPKRSTYNPQGIPEVTHHEIRLIEFGPCMFNAYQGATAGVRSMTDYFLFSRFAKDPERLQELLTTIAVEPTISAETALSNERAEGEPHSAVESSNVPLVPVRKRFQTRDGWLAWCESALK